MSAQVTDSVACSYCSEVLDEEELSNPQVDGSGEVMCDQCYDDHFRDYCGRCDEKVENTDLDTSPGQLIGVWDEDAGVAPGYYRVKCWPFFGGSMFGGHMFKHALEFFSSLDDQGKRRAAEGGYMSSPLCGKCRAEIFSAGVSA